MPCFDLDAATWAELSRLLDAALELPEARRESWVAALDEQHEHLKPRLQSLLARAAVIETGDFLARLPEFEAFAPSPQDGAAPDSIGPYRLLRELGRGGMGTVWLAERTDGLISRPVALKAPRGLWVRAGLRERMARERELLASLEHPGIARLYDAGLTASGDPYLALEYVEGKPLDEYVAARQLGVPARLELFLQVTDAVAHAHSRLIVHRDLKPANILVKPDGATCLLDFGIGKLLDEQQAAHPRLTEFAGSALTPDYASPEQIAGRPLTVATDIYSLGVILYELLSGERPYRLKRDSRGALEDAILDAEPTRPSQAAPERALQKRLAGDLDAITLKALKKAPAERYTTVQSFAEDVRRHLAGHPVSARPDSHAYRARRFLSRHKLGTATVAAGTLAVLAGAGTALWQAEMAKAQARRAESVAQFVASIFQGVNPELAGAARALTAMDVLDRARDRLAAELAGEPLLQARLRSVIARSYLGLFEPESARDLLETAFSEGEAALQQDLETARAMHLLMAQVLLELTELEEADRHLALVLGSLDERRPDAAYVQAKLVQSAIDHRRGEYDRAAVSAKEALAAADHIPGLDPALLVDAHNAIGTAAGMQRHNEESLEHRRRAFELALATFGNNHDHPKVLETEQDLAASLIDAARMDEALPHLQRSLQAARTTYGEKSLIAGQYAVRLGLVLLERGELTTAIGMIDNGIRIAESFDTGPMIAAAGHQLTLGRAYIAARRMSDAAREISGAMATIRQFDQAFLTRVVEADLAFAEAAVSGDIAPSVARLEQVIKEQDQGESRYKTHLPDIYLGILHLWNGKHGPALAHLERGVELARAQTRVAHLAEALGFLGIARLENGDLAGAGEALREDLELLESVHVAATPARAEALLGLGRVALANGEAESALGYLREADEFWAAFDPENRGAGAAAFWLGRAQAALSRPAEAKTSFDRAARLLASSPLPVHAALLRLAGDM